MRLTDIEQREMYNSVRDMKAVLLGAEGQPGQFPQLQKTVEKQGHRVSKVEKFQYTMIGIGLLASAIVYKAGEVIHLIQASGKSPGVVAALQTLNFWRF